MCCGAGGVGKTSTAAAAAAMAAVSLGGKVLVLTVDPARRLADALGMEAFGNHETRIDDEAFKRAGVEPRGELWAAMLDTRQSWDELVVDHAPDPVTARRILENPFYQNITVGFAQSHDYIAMQRLHQIHTSGKYDLIVLDTPPTRNALDFLHAPAHMAEFFSSRLLRWMTMPGRSRAMNLATRPFYLVADRILGSQFLQEIAEFFLLFQTMYGGFIERARAVERLLHDRRTAFVVVTTLEAAPLREAEFFLDALSEQGFHLGAVVLNKVLPSYLLDPSIAAVAERLRSDAVPLAERVVSSPAGAADAPAADSLDPAAVARVFQEVADSFLNFSVVAKREAEQRAELRRVPAVVTAVPYFETDIVDLAGVLRLGRAVWDG